MRVTDMVKILAALTIAALLFGLWNAPDSAPRVPRPYELQFEDEDMEDDAGGDYEAADDEEDDDEEDDDDDYETSMAAPGMPVSLLATSADLLPKAKAGQAADFAQFAPKNIGAQNFLTPAQFVGLDTQGSSLRNANRDLRPTPVIPKRDVGPWLASTIDPDMYRNNLFN